MITMHETRLARFRWSRSTQLKPGDSSYGHDASYRSHAVGRKNWLFIGSLRARDPQCELDVACSLRAEDGSRCRDVFGERPNAHAPRDGQDPGVVTRSVDRSTSARRCESTASKSDAIRPIRPSCKQHSVGYVRSCAKANGTSEGPGSQGCLLICPSGSANMTHFNRRRGSVAYRLPPQCWLRRATTRASI